ncbi:hypothetical protein SPRG_07014 [Saprolegnia parasitica CBS 223.65]|uniref:Uncharacterized protein n=1 Tax=Saprolegnia parasitica (strain CBS 223.65) TaxID=695850 RepID=A0A067CLJ8_SAPPC|nr:hypothetical protein SPRG_07014 [Saprolegnia parasitica CBS 223.65]KDO27426.1 hypothetical protein SPRG_07014 [Saprolegnia parasitica CBS 223.65]|eukprot:XP_012201866.1 hypothetical protein SPRG_07014 [Saprolegnia parasitica CBS 223.65]
MAHEPYTVSKMLDSINESMQGVGGKVQLKRDVGNGIALDTSEKEIAYLDTQSKIKSSAERAAQLTPEGKAAWIAAHREKGNELFRAGAFAEASDAYLQALAGLDFGADKHTVQVTIQNPITCNVVACMLKLEQWGKAAQMCNLVLQSEPTNMKALRQRAKAFMLLERFSEARADLTTATEHAGSESERLELQRQCAAIDRSELVSKHQRSSQRQFEKNMMKRVGSLYDDKKTVAVARPTPPASTLQRVWHYMCQLFLWCAQKRKAA